LLIAWVADLAAESAWAAPPCPSSLAEGTVCAAASQRALEIIRAKKLEALSVVQDVRTGALVAFSASQPSDLDVNAQVCPLSLSKLFLCASWWDNLQPDSNFESAKPNEKNSVHQSRVSVHEIIVGGSDFAGEQMAIALRKSVGTKTVLKDFKRYGLGQQGTPSRKGAFWAELSPTLKTRLLPASTYVSLGDETKDDEWAAALSIGEIDMRVTALHISRFLQAVGNHGVMLPPVARAEQSILSSAPHDELRNSIRIMQERTARRFESAMRDCVERGTAKRIGRALENTGWQIGGKTGSGTALLPKGSQVDGWFAGLIFDPTGNARFSVATFVRSGGYGGENAAKISAELARFLIGRN
jgi:cell division protein FtsI/penicillin-binding protein 2